MAASTPLKRLELIDCARANGNLGIETAAEQCGYGQDIETFEQELKQACESVNIEYTSFQNLVDLSTTLGKEPGIVVAPDTVDEL